MRFFRIGLITLLSLTVVVFVFHVYQKPRSPVSIALFKIGYSLTPSKHYYLHFYSPRRRDVSAWYLPSEVDEFLCKTLETTQHRDEFDAIVHLYSLQAGGREGDCVYLTSDVTREKIAGTLIDQLDVEGHDLYRKIILLEEIRLGKTLGKGEIVPSKLETQKPSGKDEWKVWMEGTALPLAKAHYIDWWKTDLSWDDKKKIDPLEGTVVSVTECCG